MSSEGGYEDSFPLPPRKKQRHAPVFPVGTVKMVKVHDFMTYAGTVTITPGPRLNLVLGPNGTGKSSLVCALCVGMAGSPKRLGRADNLGDFVRRNCYEAWTEITLSGGEGHPDVIIRRDIKVRVKEIDGQRSRTYESSFQIDRVAATIKQVQEKVTSFNIQFDNLCQFLPQDMVVEFARMDSYELLVATMKALGDSSMEKDYQTLIQMRQKIKESTAELARKDARLQGLQAEHKGQHRDYERYAQREKLIAEVKLITYKLQWLEVVSNSDMFKDAKEHYTGFKRAYEDLLEEAKDEDGPIKKLEVRLQNLRAAHKREEGEARQTEAKLLSLNNKIDEDKQQVDNQMEKIQYLHRESDRHRSDLVRLHNSVQSVEEDLGRMPVSLAPELVQRQQDLQDEQRRLTAELSRVEEDEQEHRNRVVMIEPQLKQINDNLNKLSNVRLIRLERLENAARVPGIRSTYEFVQRNRAQFRGPVYGPIAVEMDVADPKWAPFVEQQCKPHLLNYCVTCREDEMLLTDFISVKNHFSFSIYIFDGNFHAPLVHRLGDASAYSEQYGIQTTLDQTFQAPGLIKHVLANKAKIDRVYMGEDQAFRASGELFANTLVRDLYTLSSSGQRNKMSMTVSRYNAAAVNTLYTAVHPAKMLGGGPAASEADNKTAALQRDRSRVQQDLSAAHAALNKAHTQVDDMRSDLSRILNSLQQLAAKKREIETLKAKKEHFLSMERHRLTIGMQRPDPMAKEGALKHQLQALLDAIYQQAQQQVALLSELWSRTKPVIAASLAVKETEAQVASLKQVSANLKEDLRARRAEMDAWASKVEMAKRVFEQSKAQAAQDHPRSADADKECQDLPDDAQELQELRTQKDAEAQAVVCNNENVIREYQARQVQIAALEEEVAEMREVLNGTQTFLDHLKATWLPELQQLVAKINENFSRSFEAIACAGDVSLKEHEDFDKYAIEIRVKFRDGEALQLLTANRQSGGERSVSTILYLIALQEVTFTPFRVVDEINQGMDPVNERKVFAQVVDSSCQPGTPQCFLLTPKLLPGLPLGEGITVLNIMNGPSIDNSVIAASNRQMGQMLYGTRWERRVQLQAPALLAAN